MTREAVKALSDPELQDVGVWVLEETIERKQRRKREAVARIKEIAAKEGLEFVLKGQRGRPPKRKPDTNGGLDKKKGGLPKWRLRDCKQSWTGNYLQ